MLDWRLLQLADSAFPVGGFGHSGGLEAALRLGALEGTDDLARFATAAIWQTATFAVPFLRAAWRAPADAAALDARCEAAHASHVARRASRTQGRAWARACAEIFDVPAPAATHLAVVVGATTRALDVTEDAAARLLVFQAARGVVSAALRLGVVGPHASQRLLARLAVPAAVAAAEDRAVDDAATCAPVWELFGALHDTLPARLFQT